MKKQKYVIFLSIFAFIYLQGKTRACLNKYKYLDDKANNLWFRAFGQIAASSFLLIIIPMLIFVIIYSSLNLTGSQRYFVIAIQIITLYIGGVFAAYFHLNWRNKNL